MSSSPYHPPTQVISRAPSCTVGWHSDDLDMSEGTQFLTSPNTRWLVIRPFILVPGHMYEFVFSATDHYSQTASANITVIANSPPRGGNFSVVPREGLALSTPFKFALANWVSNSLLSYKFSFVATAKTITLYAGLNDTINSTLPLGTNRTVSGTVIDSLGASAESIVSVAVVLEADSTSVTNLVEDFLGSLSAGDDDAMSQVASLAETLNIGVVDNDGGVKNQTESPAQLRCTLLRFARNVTLRAGAVSTATSVELSAVTVSLVTSVPAQLTRQAQESAIELTAFITNASNALGLISESTRTSVVTILSSVIDAGLLSEKASATGHSESIVDILQTVRTSVHTA